MEYDIKKIADENKQEEENTESTLTAAEVLAGMGIKPTHTHTEEILTNAQKLIAGAAHLMHRRFTGQEAFGLSKRQYEKWQNDVKVLSKLFVSGYKSFDELYNWVDETINMPNELTEKLK
jgi:hypothetical protein